MVKGRLSLLILGRNVFFKKDRIHTTTIAVFLIFSLILYSCKKNATKSTAIIKTVAFVNKTNNTNHIWLMDIDDAGIGNNPRRLTDDTASEDYPTWSPDGKHILYQRGYNGSAIYIADSDGKNQIRLSPTPAFDVSPSWSPDGKKIVFSRLQGFIVPNQIPKTEIRVMNADGTNDHLLLPSSDFSVEPRWSVTNQIVFMSHMNDLSGPLHIFTMNSDGTNIQQLTQTGNAGDPVWSPDGKQISFGSDREGNNKLNIFVMNADGSNVRQLTHFTAPYESGDTNWSSDGTKIIFEWDVNGQKQSNPDAYAEVWTMNVDGTQQKSTNQACSCVGAAPRWKPN